MAKWLHILRHISSEVYFYNLCCEYIKYMTFQLGSASNVNTASMYLHIFLDSRIQYHYSCISYAIFAIIHLLFWVPLGHLVFLYSARYNFFPRASPFHFHTCGNRQHTHTSLYDTTCIYCRSQSSKAPTFPHRCVCRCSRTRWCKVKAIHGTTLQRQEQIRWWPPGNMPVYFTFHLFWDKPALPNR